MIMKCKITRLLSLFVVMFTMFSMSAFAGGSSYYSKATVNAVGNGKVYVKYNATDNNPAYAAEVSATSGKQSDQDHKYYIYAQANSGYAFAGWYENEACTGNVVSTESTYMVTVNATSTNSNSPTTKAYYAKFVDASTPIFGYGETRVYANISLGTYKNETLTAKNVGQVSYESSNERVATVGADGTLTLKKNGSCIIKAKASNLETSYTLTVIDDVVAGVTQIRNGDFEDWRGAGSSNHAPANWNSFETAEGSVTEGILAGTVMVQQVGMKEGGRPGSDGFYYVDIYSRDVTLAIAQGNLTTGCINAGSTTADGKGNYNFSKISDSKKSETISKIPSAIKLWVKFVPAKKNAEHPNARVSASIHDAHNYITYCKAEYESEENLSSAIAQAELNFPACDWTELTIPFKPTGNTTEGQMYILVNLATNSDPGQGQEGDHLYVDDIELVYDEGPKPEVYNKDIVITLNGAQNDPVKASIEVTSHDNDNTIDFNLKNFSLGSVNVGNITVPGLARDNEGNFSYNGNIEITEGDKEGVEEWAGPSFGPIPVQMKGTIKDDYFFVHIDISMAGQDVVVEVGDLANATLSVSDALIGTFCAPFTVAIPSDYQSYVTVSKVTGANSNNVLTLDPIDNGVIPAHTPVIVEIPMAQTLPVSGIYVKGTPVAGLLTGVYENTNAPVGSYVMQNNEGKVGFYRVASGSGKQPTVGANHCYLTAPNSSVKAFYFNEDDATGIENVNVNANEGAIYNVAGQRINKLQKGINIINGKKILK